MCVNCTKFGEDPTELIQIVEKIKD